MTFSVLGMFLSLCKTAAFMSFNRWYNTTYTLFAVSIILVYIVQEASEAEKPTLLEHVEMAIEILESMEECVVAKRASEIIRRTVSNLRENVQVSASTVPMSPDPSADMNSFDASRALNSFLVPLQMPDSCIDPSFLFEWGNLDQSGYGFQGSMDGFGDYDWMSQQNMG